MYSISKTKLSFDEQIEWFKDKGIKFNLISENEAKEFLQNNTYFFKLKAYTRNFNKYPNGPNTDKYLEFDFASLKDMSTIDMHFRKLILDMVLNIEHALKVTLNSQLTNNPDCDGYTIVKDYLLSENSYKVKNSIVNNSNSIYSSALIKKYICEENGKMIFNDNGLYSYWDFCEIISFGQFKYFFLYCKKNNYIKSTITKNYFNCINRIRNAVAHNVCLLICDNEFNSALNNISLIISKIKSISTNSKEKFIKVSSIHDYIAVLIVFDKIIMSKKIKEETKDNIYNFLDRMKKNCYGDENYYKNHEKITSMFSFIDKSTRYIIQNW